MTWEDDLLAEDGPRRLLCKQHSFLNSIYLFIIHSFRYQLSVVCLIFISMRRKNDKLHSRNLKWSFYRCNSTSPRTSDLISSFIQLWKSNDLAICGAPVIYLKEKYETHGRIEQNSDYLQISLQSKPRVDIWWEASVIHSWNMYKVHFFHVTKTIY